MTAQNSGSEPMRQFWHGTGIRTRAAHREDVFTAEAGPQNDLLCCPVAWPAGCASRCHSVRLAGLYRSGAGVRLSCLGCWSWRVCWTRRAAGDPMRW
jgi:hypothetical protein